jgi:hypothetical protein
MLKGPKTLAYEGHNLPTSAISKDMAKFTGAGAATATAGVIKPRALLKKPVFYALLGFLSEDRSSHT